MTTVTALLVCLLAQDKSFDSGAGEVALAQDKPVEYKTSKEAMMKVQLVIGDWRVTGQPKEMKHDPWTEKASWSFKIEKDVYQLALTVTDGVFWKDALLGYDVEKKHFTFEATLAAGTKRNYTGTLKEKDQELTLTQTGDDFPKERVIFSLLRSNRFLITVESQPAKGKDFAAQAVLGCTKEGVPFATGTGPVCIVTGGTGSMTVTYQGKSYFVCCSGCRTSFNDNPEKTIAEAKKQGWIKE